MGLRSLVLRAPIQEHLSNREHREVQNPKEQAGGVGNLPDELTFGHDRSAEIAEDSLRVDDVTHGSVDEGTVPDSEGHKRIVQHVQYERSSKNRRLAIQAHGTTCAACGFNFDDVYGREYADGYIQIHHVKPVSEHEGPVDPATDMVPLCSDCHSMAHRRKDTVTSLDESKALIEKAKG